jgi:hypothetical protein
MDSLKGVMNDIRIFLYGGMGTLPVTIAGTILIIGLFSANYAMLFFLIGYLILVPPIAYGLNIGLKSLLMGDWVKGSMIGEFLASIFTVKTNATCDVVIPFADSLPTANNEPLFVSVWMSMVGFFLGYMLKNGIQLYERQAADPTIRVNNTPGDEKSQPDVSKKVMNRKVQSIISIASIIIFAIVVIWFRYSGGCDRGTGIVLGWLAFGSAGWYWYDLLSQTGQDRLSDLFGIANRLLPPSAIENKPIACVPVPS